MGVAGQLMTDVFTVIALDWQGCATPLAPRELAQPPLDSRLD